MKALTSKKEKAMVLRSKGLSLNEIVKETGASKGSVSVWVRDVELTKEQKSILDRRGRGNNTLIKANKIKSEICRDRRLEWQQEGIKFSENNSHYIIGCMLYWAEGSKSKNTLQFSNSDPNMMRFFINFIREFYDVKDDKFRIAVNCYTNNGLSAEEIEDYWLNLLQLPRNVLTKTQSDKYPSSSKRTKKNKLMYGVCRISIHNTRIVQNVYGAIQEYAGFKKKEWLNG